MQNEAGWNGVADRLRATDSLVVAQFEIGDPVTKNDLAAVRTLDMTLPPPPIMTFYNETNGVKLLWSGHLGGHELEGSVNIIPLVQSALRAAADEEGKPLEGILWNDEMPRAALKQLERMAIFESLAGRSAFLTYLADETDGKLFLVDNDDIAPLIPDVATTIELLQRYAGAEGLREHLTHKDWQKRIEADEPLQRIAAL